MTNTIAYSRIIAGTMTWGKWGKALSTNEMITLINNCLDAGITTFDHADIYGDYTNEDEFGKAFAKSGIARDRVQIISKCGIQFDATERKKQVKHYEYGKEYIIWSVERSLKMLRIDYLDMLLLHRPSPLLNPNDVFEAVVQMKKEGKLKQFGVSNFSPSQIKLLEKKVAVEGNQVEFSLTANEVMNNGVLDDCLINDRMAMSWSPLGDYFRENTPATKRIRKVMGEMTQKYKATEDQLLLAWLLKHPSTIHPVVGTTNVKRLQLAMQATKIELELQDWFILLEASKGHEVA